MRLGVLADGAVGFSMVNYLIKTFPEDLVVVVVVETNDISDLAVSSEVATVVWSDETSVAQYLSAYSLDLGLMAWWPKKIHNPLLGIPSLGWINTHPSLLPHHRGKHYNFWAIVEQAPFGVSLHFVDEGLDTGDVIAQREIPFGWTDTGESLYQKAQSAMQELFMDTYPSLRKGEVARVKQDLTCGSFHNAKEMEDASEIVLDKDYSARKLLNLLRARTFPGHPACFFTENGIRYQVTVSVKRDGT